MSRRKSKLEPVKVPEVCRYPDGLAVDINRLMGGDSRITHAVSIAHSRIYRLRPNILLVTPFRAWQMEGGGDEAMSFDKNRIASFAMVKKFHSLVGTSRVGAYWLASQ